MKNSFSHLSKLISRKDLFFAIFDHDTSCHLATGYNERDLKEVLNAFVSYFYQENGVRLTNTSQKLSALYGAGFSIDVQSEPFDELGEE